MTTQNSLVSFAYEGSALRVEQDADGEPLFNVSDICTILQYANPWDAVSRHVDAWDLVKREALTPGGVQTVNFVREPGLWSLIFGSKTPAAKEVKRWVTAEVLPSIRKTGSYSMPGAHQAALDALESTRFVLHFSGGKAGLTPIESNAFVLPARDWPKVISTPDFPRELLPAVLSAVSARMQGLPAGTNFTSPSPCYMSSPTTSNLEKVQSFISERKHLTLSDLTRKFRNIKSKEREVILKSLLDANLIAKSTALTAGRPVVSLNWIGG